MESALLLDVVVGEGPAVLQLLTSKDKTLLIRGNAFLILNLGLDVVNRIRRFHLQSNRLTRQGLDENLHTTTETKHQVQGALLLDVVIRESATVFQLLASEDETLLIRRDTLLILDLGLHVVNRVRRLDFQGDGLSGKSLDKDLHTTAEAEDKVKRRLLLNVVIRQGAAILELLAGENQALLVGGDTLLVLDLRLNVVDGVGRLDLKGDGLASEGLDEDLHTATKTEDEMEGRLLLNVVVGQGTAILELLAGEDQTLLVGGNALLVLNLRLDIVDGIRGLDLEGDGLASDCITGQNVGAMVGK